ncbi:MAG TPA: hypothetical protein ENI30_14040 [Gammaproteobacteria bacterium]|jgi:hypothetical protein|nr:hypothetical protein [Gammaproteobacteria bacterium]
MSLLDLLFGKPTQDDWERVKDVKSRKTWKIVQGGIGLDAAEVVESQGYRDAIRQVRQMEAEDSWAC